MNLKILTAAMLLSTPAFASGVCIVCPPGYDCSTSTPVLDGTMGQVLTRTADKTEWRHVAEIAVPTTRTIAGLSLSEDITLEQLLTVLESEPCNLPVAGTPGSGTIESRCSSTSGTANIAGNPSSGGGTYCWCRYKKNDFTKIISGKACGITRYSAWVFLRGYVLDSFFGNGNCTNDCAGLCSSNTAWRPASVF